MNRTNRIIFGIAILIFGIGWALDLTGLLHFSLEGWWALFIIIPSLAAVFTTKHKSGPIIGVGIGVLLMLAARGTIAWTDLWKFIICLMAVVYGISILFFRKDGLGIHSVDSQMIDDLKMVDQDGRQIRKIRSVFGKQQFEFSGQRFEGADVETSFGFVGLDLRGADLLDGTVIKVECSFGGMEVRVDKDVCVRTAVESAFGSVGGNYTPPADGAKTLYINGVCSFGGIEIK